MLMGTKGRLFWACDVCRGAGGEQDLRWVVRTDVGPTPCHLVHDNCLQGLLATLLTEAERSEGRVSFDVEICADWDFGPPYEVRDMHVTIEQQLAGKEAVDEASLTRSRDIIAAFHERPESK